MFATTNQPTHLGTWFLRFPLRTALRSLHLAQIPQNGRAEACAIQARVSDRLLIRGDGAEDESTGAELNLLTRLVEAAWEDWRRKLAGTDRNRKN